MKQSKIQKTIEDFANKRTAEIMKTDWLTAINKTNKDMYEETVKMYDSLIDQFYSYKTTSYIRHDQHRPGTQKGTTLYRGQDIKAVYGVSPKLIVNFNGNILSEDERPYEYDTPEHVFDYVMFGIRFPYYNTMGWSGLYNGKYWKYKGTPNQIFNMFYDDFGENSEKIFRKYWKELGY